MIVNNFSDLDRMLPSSGNPLILPKTLPQVTAPTILQSAGNPLEATQTVRSGKDYWFALAGSGGSSNSGNISTLFGYDQYQILSSTFTDDSITFQFANNYVEQQFLSDGSNYSRITSGTNGLTLESYYLQASPFATGPRDVTLQTFDTTTGVVLSAGIDVATSSFLVSTTNGIISQTGTISSLNLTALDIDGQILTADPTTLFLNGVPLVTEASISSLSQWALDPALSTIQANNNDLVDVRAGYFSSITANGIQTNTLTAISTIQSFDYLSTALVNTDFVSAAAIVASTFNGYTVSDFLSTSPSQYDPNPLFSTIVININGFISTPDLEVSSINGHEFNQNSVIISTVNTDALNAIQISSLTGDITLQLVSTLSFSGSLGSNSFSLGGIDLGLGSALGQLTGGALGIMSLVTSGIALGTGVAALNQSRATNNINTANYEMVNGTTQLQVSTVGEFVSSVYRFSSGNPADQEIGSEFFTSTIYAPGTTLLRSMGDPLNTVSTPLSTIQAFGQWVALPEAPAVSTVSTFVDLTTQNLFVDTIRSNITPNIFVQPQGFYVVAPDGFDGNSLAIDQAVSSVSLAAEQVVSISTGAYGNGGRIVFTSPSTIVDSELYTRNVRIGPSTILTAENDFPGLAVRQTDDLSIAQVNCSAVAIGDPNSTFQGAYTYADTLDRAAVLNSSLQTKYIAYLDDLQNIQNNSVSTFLVQTSSIQIGGLPNSTITLGTALTAGANSQPAGRLLLTGQDLDMGSNDLWCQQLRVGNTNPSGLPSEIVFYAPNNTQRAFNIGNNDTTIRIQSTINNASAGYLLDTGPVNPPFFSTINNQINMMAFFPSTTSGTIGVSTISIIPNYILSAYSSTSQTVVGANALTLLTHNTTTTNVGGFTVLGSTITVPVGGLYEINTSIQFDTTTLGTNLASFWLRKNGANVAATGSLVSVTGQGETLGTITLIDTAAANDQYTIAIQSADANMTAARFAATGNIPEVPSVITNIKKIG